MGNDKNNRLDAINITSKKENYFHAIKNIQKAILEETLDLMKIHYPEEYEKIYK